MPVITILFIATINRWNGNWTVSHLVISSESEIAILAFRASRSAPTSRAASVIQLAPPSRTTALNNIKAVTKVTPQPEFKLKAKRSGKAKPKTADGFDSGSDIGLSDEDDSQERKVALRSPEKGAEARKSSKVSQ